MLVYLKLYVSLLFASELQTAVLNIKKNNLIYPLQKFVILLQFLNK